MYINIIEIVAIVTVQNLKNTNLEVGGVSEIEGRERRRNRGCRIEGCNYEGLGEAEMTGIARD